MLDSEVAAELKRLVEEKVRVAIVAAKLDDIIVIEVGYGLVVPQELNELSKFFEERGFRNVTIVGVVPNRGNLKYTIVKKDSMKEV